MSVRFGQIHTELWLIENKDYDQYCIGISNIVVDVTPEKRYAIWNHNLQRFSTGHFTSESEAAVKLHEMHGNSKNFYIVEWEIKSDD